MLRRLYLVLAREGRRQEPSDDEVALISEHDAVEKQAVTTRKPRTNVFLLGSAILLALVAAVTLFNYSRSGVSSAVLSLPQFPDARNLSSLVEDVHWETDRDRTFSQDLERVLKLGEANLAARELCLQEGNCRPNQEKVVIVATSDWLLALMNPGYVSGEQVWARSAIQALDDIGGHTRFYHRGNLSELNSVILARFPGGWDDVHLVIADIADITNCAKATDCVYSKTKNTGGAHLWKVLAFSFWPHAVHPLGSQWVLNPEDYDGSKNSFLGYSIQASCTQLPYIDPKDRFGGLTKAIALKDAQVAQKPVDASRRVVYVLAKRASFLGWDDAFRADQFAAVYKELNVRFEIGSINDSEAIKDPKLRTLTDNPAIFDNHGKLPPKIFTRILSTASVLLGVGNPITSPTPYEALCLGVPFINPIKKWDTQNTSDRSKWEAQHSTLKYLDPPYVYNIFRDDTKALVEAVRSAVANPIPRYTLAKMSQPQVTARFRTILARDYWEMMHEVMEERTRSGSKEESNVW